MSRGASAGNGGFTLIEVLIALSIAAVALVTLISTVNFHLGLIERQRTITVATMLAREKILEVSDLQIDKAGVFPEPYKDFRYEIQLGDTPYDRIKRVTLTVTKDRERVSLSRFIEERE
ncbi:MAG: type IV pilus modification PilV family protein [Thermodesulfovibrionales bacterium]